MIACMQIEKIIKALPVGVKDEMDSADAASLRETILTATATIAESAAEKAKDEKLAGAREIVKDISAGYRDVEKAQRAKINYAIFRLSEMGEPITPEEGE